MIFLRGVEDAKNQRNFIKEQVCRFDVMDPLQIRPCMENQFVRSNSNRIRREKGCVHSAIAVCRCALQRYLAVLKPKQLNI